MGVYRAEAFRARRAAPSPSGLGNYWYRVSSDGRYLTRASDGTPVRLHGDTAWAIFNELTLSDVQFYLDDRAARGINTLVVQLTNPVRYITDQVSPAARGAGMVMPYDNASGGTWDGDPAFRDINIGGSGTPNFDADFSRPVTAYWDWVDTVIIEAEKRGISMIADVLYMGFNFGATDGWWQTLQQTRHTQAVCFAHGQYLGGRLRYHPNLILNMGTDMFPTSGSEDSARFGKLFDGLVQAGCQQLISAHYKRSSDARDYSDYASRITLNSVYAGAGGGSYAPDYGRGRIAYAKTPAMPCVYVETKYYNLPSPDIYSRAQIREQGWWGALSAIGGYVHGDGIVSAYQTTGTSWQSQLGSIAMLDHQRMGRLLDSLPWYNLVPDGLGSIGTLITAGGGTAQTTGSVGSPDTNNGTDFVAACADPLGTTLIAYIPTAHTGTVTVAMTKLSATATARWIDPTNGDVTVIGSIANTGTHAFTTPGTNAAGDSDWVLLIQTVVPTSDGALLAPRGLRSPLLRQ